MEDENKNQNNKKSNASFGEISGSHGDEYEHVAPCSLLEIGQRFRGVYWSSPWRWRQ
jgi:hypothetical protein